MERTQADIVGELLVSRGWRMAVAESATGGLIGYRITQVSGSSRYFWGGVIAYANDVKMHLLGVQESTLIRWGAVSAKVALEMATGACRATGAETAVSITGIAGPMGATAVKPVGLYFVGLAVPGEAWTWRHVFTGDRAANNEAAAHAALAHLIDYLKGD